ncbi:TetR/AcrR family transcriptional regulator [Pedobacter sp. Hv1]|uniref:TetR/AcrR family transcriptional regulator n=1 Tax=Pedobacter sp. Hv1 TaxID=1740090 RepID=UPI0006D8C0B8|nr:TetR/AcrR family transcriptional regulator [Pedobacter sp. Hv1]KQB99782.1 transcriptional regulator [Pedobacter sp. Hv1]
MSKAERTRAFIIERTAPIFNKKGFAGTSLNDITAATGLTKGSIYGNFANKDEVALAVFDYNLNKLNTAVAIEFAKHTTAKEKLLVYAENYEKIFNLPFTEGGCPILNTAIEADDTHPDLKKRAAAAVLSWKNKLVQIIEEGVANKEFKTDVNAAELALSMIAMIEGGIMIAKLLGNANHFVVIMQSMKKMIQTL